uniref:Perilipin n=1 Tax=Geotrypetes seraphini TaxID=260995 RepID=A0A6P8P3R6_GEOSA|nr:perilipin-2-like [Geotrypetes seraphini]
MASVVDEPQQNVMVRVANLPLVSSTCAMVSSAYTSTKDNHPCLKCACKVAEKGVKSITAVVLASAEPIIQKLEPQIALANNYACIGLDKIEEKLPILYHPTDKVVANATDMVAGAKQAVAGTVTGAKDTITHTIIGVLDRTKGAVQESMEMTKAALSSSMNTVLGSHMMQMVSAGVDAALTKSEALVDHYLPLTEDEAAKEATGVEGFETGTQKPSYYVRLGSMSSKVRKQAYEQALFRVKDAKMRSQDAISQLNITVNLMEVVHKNLSGADKKVHDAQERLYKSWKAWNRSTGEEAPSTEHTLSRTLAIAQDLSCHLQITCLALISSIQGLPQNIQDQAHRIHSMAGNIYQNFHSITSFRDVSEQFLTTSKGQLKKMKEYLDDMMNYLVNAPLSWLLGPFYFQLQQVEQEEEENTS